MATRLPPATIHGPGTGKSARVKDSIRCCASAPGSRRVPCSRFCRAETISPPRKHLSAAISSSKIGVSPLYTRNVDTLIGTEVPQAVGDKEVNTGTGQGLRARHPTLFSEIPGVVIGQIQHAESSIAQHPGIGSQAGKQVTGQGILTLPGRCPSPINTPSRLPQVISAWRHTGQQGSRSAGRQAILQIIAPGHDLGRGGDMQ